MHFPVFLDTCVLYPVVLTDTLLRIAEQSVFRPYWSDDVLDELRRKLEKIPSVGVAGARRRTEQMDRAFPDARVSGYGALVARHALPREGPSRHGGRDPLGVPALGDLQPAGLP